MDILIRWIRNYGERGKTDVKMLQDLKQNSQQTQAPSIDGNSFS